MYPINCTNLANNCEIGEKCECGEILWKETYAQDMINYAKGRPIGHYIKNPRLYELTSKTIEYLENYKKGLRN